jgi:hypothetical protein
LNIGAGWAALADSIDLLVNKIAANPGQYFASQGWIPAGAVKAP